MVMPKPPSCAATVSRRSSTLPRSQLSACGGTSPAAAPAGTVICPLQADSAIPTSPASHSWIVDLGISPPAIYEASPTSVWVTMQLCARAPRPALMCVKVAPPAGRCWYRSPGTNPVAARSRQGKVPAGAGGGPALTIEDAVLAARARDGDTPAFVELVGRHQDRVFRFVLRMTGSRDDAMDLTQETFMKAWQAMPRWRPEAKFGTWLLQIGRNGALDLLRRRGMVGFDALEADAPVPDHAPGPEQQMRTRQRYELLETALQAIAVEHR